MDANQNRHVYTYNSGNTGVVVKNAAGATVLTQTFNFDGQNRATGITDAAGNSSHIEYGDVNNPSRPTKLTDKNGHSVTISYDAYGHILTSLSARSVQTTYGYDYSHFPLGRLTSVQEGSKTPTTFKYKEPSGLVAEIDSPTPGMVGSSSTVATTFTYDFDLPNPEGALGNLRTVTTPGNGTVSTKTTTYEYLTDYAYDASGASGSYTAPAEQIGQPLTVTDNEGKVSHFRYDVQGQPLLMIDPAGSRTDYNFIEPGQTVSLAGQIQSVQYPATGQTGGGRSSTRSAYLYPGGPLSGVTSYDEGNVGAVRQVSYTYGLEGETTKVAGSREPVSYAYDALYRLSTLTDAGGHSTSYYYRPDGHLDSVTYPGYSGPAYPNVGGADSLHYTSYDPSGNPLQCVDGRGIVTNYLYADPESLLTDIQYPASAGLNVHFNYDAYGRRGSTSGGPGMTDATGGQSYTYDDRDALTSKTVTYNGLSPQTLSYSYNPDGSRVGLSTPAGGFTYGYDSVGRLKSLINPYRERSSWAYPVPPPTGRQWTVRQTLGNNVTTSSVINPLGQITNISTSNVAGNPLSRYGGMSYDGAGNRLSVTASVPGVTALGGTTSYAYDYGQTATPSLNRGQLTQESTTRGGGSASAFAYDPAGNPTVSRGVAAGPPTADNQTTLLGFDGNGNPSTRQGAALSFDPEDHLTAVASQASSLPAQVAVGGDGITRLLWQNADGSATLTALTGGGAVASSYTYGPYPGWTCSGLAAGPNGVPRLLWNRSDGSMALWSVSASGGFTQTTYGPYAGWTAKGLAVGPDNLAHILWTHAPDGQVSLWTVNADMTFSCINYVPFTGTATALCVDVNNGVHLLWNDPVSGGVTLTTANANGTFTANGTYGPYSGWSAQSLTAGPASDSRLHIGWVSTNGYGSLWVVNADGTFSHADYGPYPGWTALQAATGPDNVTRILWRYVDGSASLWNVTPSGTVSILPPITPAPLAGTGASFGYNGDGLRAWKQNSAGVRTYYLYDRADPVCEMDGGGNVSAVNTFGAMGLLSRHVTAGNVSTFYTFDERGNVAQRTGATGAVLSSDLYDGFGARLAGGAAGDPWGYEAQSGYYTDAETGLILCTHRYYDPQAARFVTRDPIGYSGGINLYGYVSNNPTSRNDPSGFCGAARDGWNTAADFFAGVGHTSTFGLTDWINAQSGADSVVDSHSLAYGGGEVAGLAVQAAITGGSSALGEAGNVADSGISIASSAGGETAPMSLVRTINRGEHLADLLNEAKVATFESGDEHALVRLASGERALVSGGPAGIDFEVGQISRLIAHTHPTSAPPSGADFVALGKLEQKSSWVFHGGQVTKIFAP